MRVSWDAEVVRTEGHAAKINGHSNFAGNWGAVTF